MNSMADTRERVHELVDLLPPEHLSAAAGALEAMLHADDEPVTDEDRRRIAEAQALIAAGDKGTSMEDFLAEFGLTLDDFPAKN
jgi:hypothetical protein